MAIAGQPGAFTRICGDRAAVEERFKNDLIKAETAKIQALGALAAAQPKDEAAKTYAGILQRDPTHAQARLRVAELTLGRGQVREAEAQLRAILSDES